LASPSEASAELASGILALDLLFRASDTATKGPESTEQYSSLFLKGPRANAVKYGNV
jgi:hypothetical protein